MRLGSGNDIIHYHHTSLTNSQRKKRDEIRLKKLKERDSLSRVHDKKFSSMTLADIIMGPRSWKHRDSTGSLHVRNTVSKVLHRMNSKWKNPFVVVDATKSMSIYLQDLLVWQDSIKKSTPYIFFNDGDTKPRDQKLIGETGGFYPVTSNDVQKITDKIKEARHKGDGGESSENDLEALLEAQKYMNNDNQLILIADNLSKVRDIELLHLLKTPVHIILCGSHFFSLNEQYLTIAYQTKGSVHTLNNDYFNLHDMRNGDKIIFDWSYYYLSNGIFSPSKWYR